MTDTLRSVKPRPNRSVVTVPGYALVTHGAAHYISGMPNRTHDTVLNGLAETVQRHRALIAGLCVLSIIVFWPGSATPAVSAPGARVALETSRFFITFATAGLLTGFSAGTDQSVRRGFIAALIVLGMTDLWFGVIPNVIEFSAAAGGETLLPWIVARYMAGILFVLAGLERPDLSTGRLVAVTVVTYVVVEIVVVSVGQTALVVSLDDGGFARAAAPQVILALVPMALFAVGAVLADRLYRRDQQPLERWLAAALVVGVFTQLHEAAFPVGLGPVVSSADLLRALSTALLLVGAIQQVLRLRSDRTRALQLSQADLQELRDVSNQLQDYVAQEASFRSVVTHELATPVATIAAYAHVLESAALAEPSDQAAHTISTEARRLQVLVERMDQLTGIDSNILAVDLRPVLILPLLTEAAAFGRALPGGHPVSVHAQDELLQMDPTRMSQVLRNVVANAARYSPAGTPIAIAGDRARGVYQILVSDNGPGFGSADADHLFGKYQRGGVGTQQAGTGLGLWIAREITRAHGGTISVVKPELPGGRLQVTLPLGADDPT